MALLRRTGVTVEDEGSVVRRADRINFVGSGVTATDGGDKVVVTITGGGGGGLPSAPFVLGDNDPNVPSGLKFGSVVFYPPNTLTNRPAASATVAGALYFATDGGGAPGRGVLYRSDGTSLWEAIAIGKGYADALYAALSHTHTVSNITDFSAALTTFANSSEFATAVRANRLDQMAAPTASVGMNSQRIISLAEGVAPSDAATVSQSNGWVTSPSSWTRTSNTTFTISGDVTAIYRPGLKLRWQESGVQKFGVVRSSSFSSPNTTVTMIGTTDYVMAVSPDASTAAYSLSPGLPPGFPSKFAFTPTATGFSSGPTFAFCWWSVMNGFADVSILMLFPGTSNSTSMTVSLPINALDYAIAIGPGQDNGTNTLVSASVTSGASVMTFTRQPSGAAFTASGNKSGSVTLRYPHATS
jgi:uncharacterized repeat protein (TIGR03803 family)